MKDIITFSDWTAVGQIKNQINSDIRAEASAIINKCGDSNEIVGYDLVVYLRNPYITLYKVKVEMGQEGVWSLTNDQAVEMLNSLGFYCQYELPPYYQNLSDKQIKTLHNLKDLQFSQITRTFKEGCGKIIATDGKFSGNFFDFSCLSDYNYLDWIFLPLDIPQMISSVLSGSELSSSD